MSIIHTDRAIFHVSAEAMAVAQIINDERLTTHPDDVWKAPLLRFQRFGGGDVWIDLVQVVAVTD